MRIVNQLLAPLSRLDRANKAEAFAQQLREQHEAAEKGGAKHTDITRLPFRVQMEVKGRTQDIGRLFANSGVPWTAQSSSGD